MDSADGLGTSAMIKVAALVPGDWVELAACRSRDPELFYPVGTAGPALRQVAAAKAVCARCPVADDCLEWALDEGEPHGIWGGATPEERRFLRRDRRDRRDVVTPRGTKHGSCASPRSRRTLDPSFTRDP